MFRVGVKTQRIAYIVCGLLLVLADILFWTRMAYAAPAYTPYANSVAAQNGINTGTQNNAVGAPDGQNASLAGLNSSLTLDMGDGEQGTGTLKIYFGPINLQAQVNVEFLDDSQGVIKSEQRQLFLELQASEETFAYDWRSFDKGYRFVRVSSLAATALGIDSVEALGFIGSSPTQDTDGDGKPDREDGNPLKPDQNSGSGGSGGENNTTTIIRTNTNTNTNRSGSTTTVNTPASTANDKDGDQMDDAWEAKYGLDPNNKADAATDKDGDKLSNVKEYQYDTNPTMADTDNDGIFDGWEVAHGLNAKVDDANEDPDFDYVTNRGEAYMDSNPFVADTFASLAAKLDPRPRVLSILLWIILLIVALLAWWRIRRLLVLVAKRTRRNKSSKPKSKSSLPPL